MICINHNKYPYILKSKDEYIDEELLNKIYLKTYEDIKGNILEVLSKFTKDDKLYYSKKLKYNNQGQPYYIKELILNISNNIDNVLITKLFKGIKNPKYDETVINITLKNNKHSIFYIKEEDYNEDITNYIRELIYKGET